MNIINLIEEKEMLIYEKRPNLILYFVVLSLVVLILINYSVLKKVNIYYSDYLIKDSESTYLRIEDNEEYLKDTILISGKEYKIKKYYKMNNMYLIDINYDFNDYTEYKIKIKEEDLLTYLINKIKERK